MQQGTKEWLQMRKNHIGASDAPVIMQVSPYKTRYQLWEEKLGLTEEKTNPAMTYGRNMEEPARQAYERLTGNIMAPSIVYHPEKPFMMASLDGLSLDKSMAVEIKNPCEEDHEIAKDGKVPEKYIPQLQHQLAVLGINFVHYFSFRKGDYALVEVPRDDKYIEKLYGEEESFWDSVVNLKEPDLSSSDYLEMTSPEWEQMVSEWRKMNSLLDEYKEKEDECRKQIIALANNRNVRGSGLKVTRSVRKGAVDYSKIPELNGVDLEKFRKSATISWRLT